MIADVLIPKLQQHFPDRGLRTDRAPAPCAVFPGIHPNVGDVLIYDDGHEVTVVAGNFTHGHFSIYDEKLDNEQRAEEIANDVVAFLNELFADRIVLWGSHKGSGGWFARDGDSEFHRPGQKLFVWSGPLSN